MKYCSKCGKEIFDEAVVCPECGCTQENSVQKKHSGKASLIWGIISMVTWFIPIAGFPCSIVGIVLGVKNVKKIGLYLSIAGLVLTIINSALGALMGAGLI